MTPVVLVIVIVIVAVVVLGAVAVSDVRRRRRVAREWEARPAAELAARVDIARLTTVRRSDGEIAAIKALRDQLPGCPLARARDLVAELTGVPTGSR